MFNSSSWYHTWALCCTEFLCTARLNSYTAPWYSILVLHSTQHTKFLSILQTLNSICIDLTTFWRSCTYIIQYAQEFSMVIEFLYSTLVQHTGVAQHTQHTRNSVCCALCMLVCCALSMLCCTAHSILNAQCTGITHTVQHPEFLYSTLGIHYDEFNFCVCVYGTIYNYQLLCVCIWFLCQLLTGNHPEHTEE